MTQCSHPERLNGIIVFVVSCSLFVLRICYSVWQPGVICGTDSVVFQKSILVVNFDTGGAWTSVMFLSVETQASKCKKQHYPGLKCLNIPFCASYPSHVLVQLCKT